MTEFGEFMFARGIFIGFQLYLTFWKHDVLVVGLVTTDFTYLHCSFIKCDMNPSF